jgi:4-amino-4-deoxy-L-arabinose transferase-like glycosyltransferase
MRMSEQDTNAATTIGGPPIDPGADDADDAVTERTEAHHDGAAPGRMPLTPHQRRWLVGIVAVATVLRVAWLAYAHVEPPTNVYSGDSWSYWYYGNEIAAGRGYIHYVTNEPTAYYPIGFPAILAALFWLTNHVPFVDPDPMLVLCSFQVVISAATVALTFVVARRLFGARVGLIAAGIMALFPNLIYQVTTIQVETTFIFLSLATLAVLVDHDWSSGAPSRNRLLAFAAVFTLTVTVRPFAAPVLLGLALAMLAIGAGWRRALAAASIPLVVLVVASTPWTIRNAVRLDAFVPSSTNMGDTLCIDRNDDAEGGFRWSFHDGCADNMLPEGERNRANTSKAVHWVIDNPDRELVQIVRRARLMFKEDHDGILGTEGLGSGPIFSEDARYALQLTGDWYFAAVLFAGVLGLPFLARRPPRPERRLVLSLAVPLLVIPLLLWGNPRFHSPLDPFLAVSAAAVMSALVSAATRRRLPGAGQTPSEPPPGPGPGGADEPSPPGTTAAEGSPVAEAIAH